QHAQRSRFNRASSTYLYSLSLHDALPIWASPPVSRRQLLTGAMGAAGAAALPGLVGCGGPASAGTRISYWNLLSGGDGITMTQRSEEHTSELQTRFDIVCRLLLDKKKIKK